MPIVKGPKNHLQLCVVPTMTCRKRQTNWHFAKKLVNSWKMARPKKQHFHGCNMTSLLNMFRDFSRFKTRFLRSQLFFLWTTLLFMSFLRWSPLSYMHLNLKIRSSFSWGVQESSLWKSHSLMDLFIWQPLSPFTFRDTCYLYQLLLFSFLKKDEDTGNPALFEDDSEIYEE